jgi:hypothetical protein
LISSNDIGAPKKSISAEDRLFTRLAALPQVTVSIWIRFTSECHPYRANCSLPSRSQFLEAPIGVFQMARFLLAVGPRQLLSPKSR